MAIGDAAGQQRHAHTRGRSTRLQHQVAHDAARRHSREPGLSTGIWERAGFVPTEPAAVLGVARRIVGLEVPRRGVRTDREACEFAPDQMFGWGRGSADSHIGLALGQVDQLIGGHHLQRDIGIARDEGGDVLHQERGRYRIRQTQPNGTGHALVTAQQVQFDLLDLPLDPVRVLEQVGATVGQVQPLPTAVEQPRPELAFQLLQPTRDGRGMNAEFFAGAAHRTAPGQRDENLQIFPVKTRHGHSSPWSSTRNCR